ncbi:hypothetical protein PR048_017300 [Dryococelus australis]|uniref:Uncharacterized protein n=1 Tax=Dryococelus australis TaxID=614101 RepID=A0ABQ9H973_9NEOP|nr:hypothetical protein PR048_017300 [Dryococelus australis]
MWGLTAIVSTKQFGQVSQIPAKYHLVFGSPVNTPHGRQRVRNDLDDVRGKQPPSTTANGFHKACMMAGLEETIFAFDKIDILLYVLGEREEDIWSQFQPAVPDILDRALKAFRQYSTPRTNTTFERYKFN